MALDTAKATVTLRGLTKTFDDSVQGAAPFYPEVCTIVPSDRANEQYGFLGDMPGMREWLGDRQFKELRAGNFVLESKLWESSLSIQKTDLADDKMGMYGPLMSDLGEEAALHPDELFFQALIAGETSACFDGQTFFDNDHSWGDSGPQSNDLTYPAATGTTPTPAEFLAAYTQAWAAMQKFKNDQGKPMNRPTSNREAAKLLCLTPPDLFPIALKALTATVLGTDDNVVVAPARIESSAYLTDATKFYLFDISRNIKPMVFQARDPLSRMMKGLEDIEFKDVKFMAQARYNVGYLAWWKAVLTQFT